AYRDLLLTLRFDRLAALPYAALPIGTAVSLAGQWPMVYPRREAKDYGTQVAIEGLFEKGDRVVVLDDVATRGDSKLEAFDRLEGAGLVIDDVVVLIDREGGARALVEARGKRFHAVFTLSQLVDHWLATGRIDLARATTVRDFLSASA
nr:bifunctional orotidine-5'-phosphate decarboxylase/orotate phosphoribosyltransferase [Deltaproteobacteria bacterium]